MHEERSRMAALEVLLERSSAGGIRFGELVALLDELGVESYHADYRRGETTYYLDGATHVAALQVPELAGGAAFDAAAVRAAVAGAQAGTMQYPEFVRATVAAGCVGYWVWISGRRVDYHGRRGETHVESFPGQSVGRGNVELVKTVYAALGRRDLAAFRETFGTDAELDQSGEVPWGGHYVGAEGAQAFYMKLVARVDSAVTLERFIDAGDHVVAVGRTRGVVKANGRRFDVPFAHVWTVQDGRVVRVRYCIDNPTMLAALG